MAMNCEQHVVQVFSNQGFVLSVKRGGGTWLKLVSVPVQASDFTTQAVDVTPDGKHQRGKTC